MTMTDVPAGKIGAKPERLLYEFSKTFLCGSLVETIQLVLRMIDWMTVHDDTNVLPACLDGL